jgi:hypothetical protein
MTSTGKVIAAGGKAPGLAPGDPRGDLAFTGDAEAGLPWSTQAVMGIMVSFVDDRLKR